MNAIVEKQYFLVSSNTPSFSTALDIDPSIGFDHISISSASIPKTYYVLPNDCVLQVTEGKNITNVSFLKGNYSLTSFKTIFTSNVAGSGVVYTYTISYPSQNQLDTGKFTFAVSNNGGVQPTFLVTDTYLSRVMGLAVGVSYPFVSNSLTSANCVNFQSYDQILIKSNCVKNRESLLQEVYTAGNPYNTSVVWQNSDLLINAKILNPVTSNVYNFALLDSNDGLINLNGSEWSFVLCAFKISNIDMAIKSYLHLKTLEMDRASLE